jgi:hypothetical protein
MRLQVLRTADTTELFVQQMHTKDNQAKDRLLNITTSTLYLIYAKGGCYDWFQNGISWAHFNPVCVALTNGETEEAYDWAYRVVTETQ